MDESDVSRTARAVVSIPASQGHVLPRPYSAEDIFGRAYRTGCLIRDGGCAVTGHDHEVNARLADESEAIPEGATAQNSYRGLGDYECRLCGSRLFAEQLDDHSCQDR